jgi:hypothetical protein
MDAVVQLPRREPMTRDHLLGLGTLLVAILWPAHAAAAEFTPGAGGEISAVAILGVAAAVVWHHLALHREELAHRWHDLHLADRLHRRMHLAERLHGLHLGDRLHVGAALAHLHLPRRRR